MKRLMQTLKAGAFHLVLVSCLVLASCATPLFPAAPTEPLHSADHVPPGWSGPVEHAITRVTYQNIAASGSTVHLGSGDGVVRYRRSPDAGVSWQAWSELGPGTLYLEEPIAAEGDTVAIVSVHIDSVIYDFFGRRPVGDLYLHLSTDNGEHWLPRRRLTRGAKALRVSLAVSGTTLHVVWMDYRTQRWEIRYLRSTDLGATWAPEVVVAAGTNAVGAERPTLEAAGETLHLAWMEARDDEGPCVIERGTALPHCTEIYYARSTDGGGSWAPAERLTDGSAYAGRPDIEAGSGVVLIAFDRRTPDGVQNIALLRSADGGRTWVQSLLAPGPSEQTHARLANDGGGFVAAWMGAREGSYELFYSSSEDGGAWSTPEPVPSSGGAGAPGVAVSGEGALVSWSGPGLRVARRVFDRR